MLSVPLTVVVEERVAPDKATPPTVAVVIGAVFGGNPGVPGRACSVMVTL